jgi:hypothetical protein
MFVFLTHLVNCCLSNLLSDGPLPPPFLSALHAYIVHSKYKGGGWSVVDLRNVGSYFLNRDRLKYPTLLKNLAWTWELVTQLPEST